MRILIALLLSWPTLAAAFAPSAAPNQPMENSERPQQQRPKRFDEIDPDLPPVYRGPWGERFNRGVGGCCHEARDGQIYCHGVRS